MTKAEEAALRAYPPIQMNCDGEIVHPGYDKHTRDIYQDGYEQAEKDRALTWEDIRSITKILEDITNEDIQVEFYNGDAISCYKEVLRRFTIRR